MNRQIKKLMSFMIAVTLILSCGVLDVDASELAQSKITTEEAVTRALLKLARTYQTSIGVKITVNYTMQESSNSIIAIDKVYISGYDPSTVSSARIDWYQITNLSKGKISVVIKYTKPGNANEQEHRFAFTLNP